MSKNLIRKIFICLIIIILGIFVIVAAFIIIPESYFFPYPEIDTYFAPDFSFKKVEKLSVGESRKEVEKKIGQPLGETYPAAKLDGLPKKYKYCKTYSQDGKAAPLDFAWIIVNVCYDENDQFVEWYKDIAGN